MQSLIYCLHHLHENLRKEGVAEERIKFVGNIMIDSLFNNLERANRAQFIQTWESKKAPMGF